MRSIDKTTLNPSERFCGRFTEVSFTFYSSTRGLGHSVYYRVVVTQKALASGMAGVMSGGDTIDAAWKAVRRPRPFESFGLIHASPGVGAGYLAGIQNSLAGLTTHRSPITA